MKTGNGIYSAVLMFVFSVTSPFGAVTLGVTDFSHICSGIRPVSLNHKFRTIGKISFQRAQKRPDSEFSEVEIARLFL